MFFYRLNIILNLNLSSKSRQGFQQFSSVSIYQVLEVMLKSWADSTVKSYIRVIRKYMDWCKINLIGIQLTFFSECDILRDTLALATTLTIMAFIV